VRLLNLLFFLPLCFCSVGFCVEDKTEHDRVLQGWEHRCNIAGSALYRVHGQVVEPKGMQTQDAASEGYYPEGSEGPYPQSDFTFPTRLSVLLDFQKHRVRREIERQVFFVDALRYIPDVHWDLFDGTNYQYYRPREWNDSEGFTPSRFEPDIRLYGTSMQRPIFSMADVPIMLAHGMVNLESCSYSPQSFGTRPTVDDLVFLARSEIKKGESCLVFETKQNADASRYYEYWIDLDKQAAVRRVSRMMQGSEVWRLDIQYTQHAEHWLPSAWTWASMSSNTGTPASETYTVDSIEINPDFDASSFSVELTTGMVVYDAATDGRYVVGAPGSPDRSIGEVRLAETTSQKSSWRNLTLIITILVTAVLLAAVVAKYRQNAT
jgi:hypothetical protein